MAQDSDLGSLSDEELVERFREAKGEGSGGDPALTPPDVVVGIREEMERRGIAPDREDVVPDSESVDEDDPVVDDRA